MRVAFIGLGVMGFPIARHLAAAGFDITVYNRTRAKAEAWVAAHGGQLEQGLFARWRLPTAVSVGCHLHD